MPLNTTTTVQALSISLSLIASGGIAALTLFDVPILKAQPASRSLPSIRWLFSRGSHIFPQAAFLSSSGFAYLAYNALQAKQPLLNQLTQVNKSTGFLIAAIVTFSIGPITSTMLPTNFDLITRNERKGGTRSERNAEETDVNVGTGSAEESVNNEGQVNQWTDRSGPQEKTLQDSSEKEDKEVRDLLDKFGALNTARAVVVAAGGFIGLLTSLA